MTYEALAGRFPPHDRAAVDRALRAERASNTDKIVVLDDDPTGTQTVHGVDVYTDWSPDSIRGGFAGAGPLFFILTNSRSFDRAKTEAVHRAIARDLLEQGAGFIPVSRGDSTLRGHYPGETAAMNRVFAEGGRPMDGEIIAPCFPEGGRYTAGDIHYVRCGAELVPTGETEFAGDRTFGYQSSNLREWVEEKTGGAVRAGDVASVSLEQLRARDYGAITETLLGSSGFAKVVVNALDYDDLKVFATAFYRAKARGKRFLFRSAAALVRVLGGIDERPLLTPEELWDKGNPNGGLIVAGSHVARTTAQLKALAADPSIVFVELDQRLATDAAAFAEEARRAAGLVDEALRSGRTAVLMTRRERFDLGTGNREDELRLAVTIGDRLTGIVADLTVRPSFLIAKGGITSSDVATKGLGIRRAEVAGQILPGVPVWRAGAESKFRDLMLVVFPGNVGGDGALLQAVERFRQKTNTGEGALG